MNPTSTGQLIARYRQEVARYSGTEPVRDTAGRIVAPPQTILPAREPGPWNLNADQRSAA